MAKTAFDWFDHARYGMFIHWGIYALLGRGEQVLFRERRSRAEYEQLAKRFNPRRFNADDWARQGKEAGMKYAVLTAKHHDGFCLFDSALTDYSSAKTAAGRDLVAEYVTAFRKQGLRVGLYYSLADWRFPAYFSGPDADPKGFEQFLQYIHGQVRELCVNYGKIDVLWFDGYWPHTAKTWQSEKLDRTIRRHQPHIMINDRLHCEEADTAPAGKAPLRTLGYFNTAEQRSPSGDHFVRPVETCRTTQQRWWGYCRSDRLWKSPKQEVALLSDAAHREANLLLNVGPKADGTFPAPFQRILRETGRWLKINGAAIYGCTRCILDTTTLGYTTVNGNSLYIHVHYWPGRTASIYGLANKVRSVHILGRDDSVRFSQGGLRIQLDGLPAQAPDPSCTVLEIKVVGVPKEDPSVVRLWEKNRDLSELAQWAADGAVAPGLETKKRKR